MYIYMSYLIVSAAIQYYSSLPDVSSEEVTVIPAEKLDKSLASIEIAAQILRNISLQNLNNETPESSEGIAEEVTALCPVPLRPHTQMTPESTDSVLRVKRTRHWENHTSEETTFSASSSSSSTPPDSRVSTKTDDAKRSRTFLWEKTHTLTSVHSAIPVHSAMVPTTKFIRRVLVLQKFFSKENPLFQSPSTAISLQKIPGPNAAISVSAPVKRFYEFHLQSIHANRQKIDFKTINPFWTGSGFFKGHTYWKEISKILELQIEIPSQIIEHPEVQRAFSSGDVTVGIAMIHLFFKNVAKVCLGDDFKIEDYSQFMLSAGRKICHVIPLGNNEETRDGIQLSFSTENYIKRAVQLTIQQLELV